MTAYCFNQNNGFNNTPNLYGVFAEWGKEWQDEQAVIGVLYKTNNG